MRKSLTCLLCSFLFLVLCLTGCSSAPKAAKDVISPEAAVKELQQAVTNRDWDRVSSYFDVEFFLADTYDNSAWEMSVVISQLHDRYPDDPFFWHDTEFMQQYALDHRDISLLFINRILGFYFSKAAPAANYDDNPESWLSGELAKIHSACSAEIQDIHMSDAHHAEVALSIKGDGSPYGNLADGITLKLAMEKQTDGTWKFTRITNIRELIFPVADKAEMFWTLQGWQ